MNLIIKKSKEKHKYGTRKVTTFKFINPYNRQLQKVLLVNEDALLSWIKININYDIQTLKLI